MSLRTVIVATCLLMVGGSVSVRSNQGVSPVQKVIQLLEENKLKVTSDLAAEEKEMAEYAEFCDTESSEKGYAIQTADRKIADLNAKIEEAESKIPKQEK